MKNYSPFLFLPLFILLLASCNPAKDISGTYSGNYTSPDLFYSGGLANLHITENGTDKVNLEFESEHYDYIIEGIGVERKTWSDGEVFYDLNYEVYPWHVWGTIFLSADVVMNIRNNDLDFYIEFIRA